MEGNATTAPAALVPSSLGCCSKHHFPHATPKPCLPSYNAPPTSETTSRSSSISPDADVTRPPSRHLRPSTKSDDATLRVISQRRGENTKRYPIPTAHSIPPHRRKRTCCCPSTAANASWECRRATWGAPGPPRKACCMRPQLRRRRNPSAVPVTSQRAACKRQTPEARTCGDRTRGLGRMVVGVRMAAKRRSARGRHVPRSSRNAPLVSRPSEFPRTLLVPAALSTSLSPRKDPGVKQAVSTADACRHA